MWKAQDDHLTSLPSGADHMSYFKSSSFHFSCSPAQRLLPSTQPTSYPGEITGEHDKASSYSEGETSPDDGDHSVVFGPADDRYYKTYSNKWRRGIKFEE